MNEPITILVVEDDELTRAALIERLNQERFITIEANDGKEGLDCAKNLVFI